jgi:hypothetical protein
MLAGLAISILEVLKTTCMTCQWLIPLMIQNCSPVMIWRNWARGMDFNIGGDFCCCYESLFTLRIAHDVSWPFDVARKDNF